MTHTNAQIYYQGEWHPASTPLLSGQNRAFKFGDALFESMVYFQGNCPLETYHWARLHKSLSVLAMDPPKKLTPSLLRQITQSFSKKTPSFRLRLQVFRLEGKKYTPTSSTTDFLLEVEPIENDRFGFEKEGLSLGVFSDWTLPIDPLSGLKSSNSLYYIMAKRKALLSNWDEVLLLNNKTRIADAASSTLWVDQGDRIVCPSIEEGALYSVSAAFLLDQNPSSLKIEKGQIHLDDLHKAQSLYLTNAVQGPQWVSKFDGKTFSPGKIKELIALFNKYN